MLTLQNISLERGDKKIFSGVGFSIDIGSILVITGRNGSGKTSLLKIIAGISTPKTGEILLDEENVENLRSDFNADTQFISQKNFLKQDLSIRENLEFYTRLSSTQMALPAALQFFNLTEIQDEKVKNLSSGTQRKAILSKLLCCPSTLWLLDEPSINLDQNAKQKLYELIKTRARENGIVIIATHDEMFFDLGHKINLDDYS